MSAHPVRIYRVRPSSTANRFHLLSPDEFFLRYPNANRNAPMCEHWHDLPIQCSIEIRGGSLTHFGFLMPGALTWSFVQDVEEHAVFETDLLRAECETLALTVGKDTNKHLLINPRVVNALDRRHSELQRDEYGRITGVERYAFVPHRLQESLFRIPEGGAWDIFTIYQLNQPEDVSFSDLYSGCTNLGLTGLDFEPVWEGEYIS